MLAGGVSALALGALGLAPAADARDGEAHEPATALRDGPSASSSTDAAHTRNGGDAELPRLTFASGDASGLAALRLLVPDRAVSWNEEGADAGLASHVGDARQATPPAGTQFSFEGSALICGGVITGQTGWRADDRTHPKNPAAPRSSAPACVVKFGTATPGQAGGSAAPNCPPAPDVGHLEVKPQTSSPTGVKSQEAPKSGAGGPGSQ